MQILEVYLKRKKRREEFCLTLSALILFNSLFFSSSHFQTGTGSSMVWPTSLKSLNFALKFVNKWITLANQLGSEKVSFFKFPTVLSYSGYFSNWQTIRLNQSMCLVMKPMLCTLTQMVMFVFMYSSFVFMYSSLKRYFIDSKGTSSTQGKNGQK